MPLAFLGPVHMEPDYPVTARAGRRGVPSGYVESSNVRPQRGRRRVDVRRRPVLGPEAPRPGAPVGGDDQLAHGLAAADRQRRDALVGVERQAAGPAAGGDPILLLSAFPVLEAEASDGPAHAVGAPA